PANTSGPEGAGGVAAGPGAGGAAPPPAAAPAGPTTCTAAEPRREATRASMIAMPPATPVTVPSLSTLATARLLEAQITRAAGTAGSGRDHSRGTIPGVSYRPRPRHNPAEERSSDARPNRFFGEQLDRPRHDGADVSAGAIDAPDADGGADGGAQAAAPGEKEKEGVAAQGEEEESREEAAESQGEAAREGQAEEGGEKAAPLAYGTSPTGAPFGWLEPSPHGAPAAFYSLR